MATTIPIGSYPEQYHDDTPPKRLSVKVVSLVATFGGLLFGYDTGVIAGALPFMRLPSQLGLSDTGVGLVTSSLLLGAAFGALFGGRLSDRKGRRQTILVLAVIFFVAALGCAFAPSLPIMIGCRVLLGLAVGGASATVPVFISEMAPKAIRGQLVTINELMIVSGQLLAYIVNAIMANTSDDPGIWRYMLVMCSIPAVALFFGMTFMPETPRWLASRGRYSDCLRVLSRVRPPADVDLEMTEIQATAEKARAEAKGSWKDLKTPWIRRVFVIGIALAIMQQVTGVNTIMYYAPTILQATGLGRSASITATIANGVISVLATLFGIWMLGRAGRRTMLLTGQAGITAALILIAVAFAAFFHTGEVAIYDDFGNATGEMATSLVGNFDGASYIVLALMMVFLAFQQGLISPVTWLMLSEVFPIRLRGFGIGVAAFSMWTINAIISFSFPVLLGAVGGTWTFLIFGAINVCAITFAYFNAPETRGYSLEALEEMFRIKYTKAPKA
jgi:major inositol transporter-like SP family MFS transporter